MICGVRSIRHYAILGGRDKTVQICVKKEKTCLTFDVSAADIRKRIY